MSAPNAEKGARYLASLDQVLCNGSWSEVPELARKVDKHAPDRKCLTLTARSEAKVVSASHRPASASSNTSTSIHGLNELVQPLEDAVKANESIHEDDAFVARVCLASIYLLQGAHDTALKLLPPLYAQKRINNTGPGPLGWLEVAETRAVYIRAACLEAQREHEEARKLYTSFVSRAPGSRTPELRRWTERILGLACTSLDSQVEGKSELNIHNLSNALRAFRAWGDFWQRAKSVNSNMNGGVIDIPRRKVWRAYYELLSRVLTMALVYTPGKDSTSDLLTLPSYLSGEQLQTARQQQFAETRKVEATYESLLLNETQFPKASQSNTEVEVFCAQAFHNFNTFCGPTFSASDLGVDGKEGVGRNLLDLLYRSATKTFHSTAILRFLFETHSWLGEFELAMNAFTSYCEIVSKAKARAEKTGKHELGFDDDDTAVRAAANAVSVLCQYGDRDQAEEGMKVCENISTWLGLKRLSSSTSLQTNGTTDEQPSSTSTESRLTSSSLSLAYRAIAIGNAQYARLTYKPEDRSRLQDNAVELLQKALAQDPSDVETSYTLAFVQIERRDVAAAVSILKQTLAQAEADEDDAETEIERHQKLLPLWHLLSLCLSSKDEFTAALAICTNTLDSHPTDERDKNAMNAHDKEQLLQMHMTQLNLLELTDGVDAAVSRSNELLGGYATLFGSPEKAKEVTKPPPTTASTLVAPKSRGTLRSIAGSITGRSRSRGNGSSSLPTHRSPVTTSSPESIRTSVETIPRPENTTTTTAANVDGGPIQITVTNERGQAEQHHHRLPFRLRGHHGSDVRSKSVDSRYSHAGADTRRDPSPPPPLPHGSDAVDHAQAIRPAVETSNANAQQDVKQIEHNMTHSSLPLPTGHEKQPPGQDIRLPAPHPVSSRVSPIPQHSKLMQRRHSTSLLSGIWIFIAGLYLRAEAFEDASFAVDEAAKLVDTLELDLSQSEAGLNAMRLFQKGWGGGKSIDHLWAEVWAARGSISLARSLPFEAMAAFEQALLYYPDHPEAMIGMSNLLMDIYEEKLPAEEPKPLLPSQPSASGSSLEILAATMSTVPTSANSEVVVNQNGVLPGSQNLAAQKKPKSDPSPAELNRLACRDRAYMLLSTLTRLGTGWDNSEAWLALARAHELSGELKKAKQALWWVVELEETRPIRDLRDALP
ncbi:TPR-like protein [Polychaeton citri CBS 116435]|uniref:TPR-like protein n=1 Tax=Polychaeton citri CBS 116435 TaxID=1314669 RepID=A0A9P4Q581_9PEZI|nr:TPR-like protein [Polychaeton citri CBS 116435]